MTNLDDFDRALGAFLRDGPSVAPEPPVIAALAHARATPRRRDPFLALRRDVMARAFTVAGLRPGLVLAATALVAAAIGIAVLGGGHTPDTLPTPSAPGVVPSASGSPSPSIIPVETPRESVPPSPTPTPLPRVTTLPPLGRPAVEPIHVKLGQCCSDALSVDVVDESGRVTAAVSGPAVEGGSVEDVVVANDGARTLRVSWPGSPCDTVHRLTIDPAGTTITIDRPGCFGDAVPADRVVLLTFDVAVNAGAVRGSMVTGRGGVDLPSWTATGIDKAGAIFSASLFDASQTATRFEAVDVTDVTTLGADVQLSEEAPDVIRLLWNGCGDQPALILDPTGREWTLATAPGPCESPTVRGLDITFSGPLAVDTVRLTQTTSAP
jgi:hypothetical protein